MMRTLPDDQSAGSVVAAMLPTGAHYYVKAFGTLGAGEPLASAANRDPRRAVLLLRRRRRHGCDNGRASDPVLPGFEPLKAGGVAEAGRIEMPGGDLHQAGA